MGAKDRILDLLLANVEVEMPREDIIELAAISEYARRIRELRNDEGMDIEVAKPRGDYIHTP